MMSTLQAIILGIVQGITEFLPVSSSGHLQLFKEMMGVELTQNLTFDVTLHAGTVCSTIVVLWREIRDIFTGLFSREFNEEKAYVLKIVISMIPVGIVGFTFKDSLEMMLSSQYILLIVGVMLLITALLLWYAYYAKPRQKDSISYRDAFIIGLSQAAAVMPGISRSGATIATGIILGNKKESVAKFSFLMVLAPILGNTLLDIIGSGGDLNFGNIGTMPLIAGFISSFIIGSVACKFMIDIIKRGKLIYFAYYCLVVGSVAIIGYLLG